MKSISPLILLSVFLLSSVCQGAHSESAPKRNEAFYRDQWAKANGGKTEVRLPDGTRCDVETKTHAVEVDFAEKWAEAFGQALWYSFQTNKKAGVVMILRKPEDKKFVIRIQSLAKHHKIDLKVWTVGP